MGVTSIPPSQTSTSTIIAAPSLVDCMFHLSRVLCVKDSQAGLEEHSGAPLKPGGLLQGAPFAAPGGEDRAAPGPRTLLGMEESVFDTGSQNGVSWGETSHRNQQKKHDFKRPTWLVRSCESLCLYVICVLFTAFARGQLKQFCAETTFDHCWLLWNCAM